MSLANMVDVRESIHSLDVMSFPCVDDDLDDADDVLDVSTLFYYLARRLQLS